MFTVQDVLIDALWVLGLAGILATFSYMSWYRDVQRWRWRHALAVPRLLFPLCLSLMVFCVGIGLNGLASWQPAPWWETALWSGLALLFAAQSVVYGLAGQTHGWDAPTEDKSNE